MKYWNDVIYQNKFGCYNEKFIIFKLKKMKSQIAKKDMR